MTARFIVSVQAGGDETKEHRVTAEDAWEAAFKVGLFVATQQDGPLPVDYNTLDAENQIVSIDRVYEERTREWDQA